MNETTFQLLIALLIYLGIILIRILPILVLNLIECIRKHRKIDDYKHLDPKTFNKTIPYVNYFTPDMRVIFNKNE